MFSVWCFTRTVATNNQSGSQRGMSMLCLLSCRGEVKSIVTRVSFLYGRNKQRIGTTIYVAESSPGLYLTTERFQTSITKATDYMDTPVSTNLTGAIETEVSLRMKSDSSVF